MFRVLIVLFQKEYCISVAKLLFSGMCCESTPCNLRENWQETKLFAGRQQNQIPSKSLSLINILNILGFFLVLNDSTTWINQ